MTSDDFLTMPHELQLNVAEIVSNMTWAQRLALVQRICEDANVGEPIAEIRAIVNAPSFDEITLTVSPDAPQAAESAN